MTVSVDDRAAARARHAQVKQVFQSVIELEPTMRPAAVKTACGDDDVLRRDVLALLAHHQANDDLIVNIVEPPRDSRDPFLLIGVLLDGRYQVERFVAEGGFGAVYRAQQIRWRRPVAIKVFKLEPGQSRAMCEAFIREGALLSDLSRKTTAIVQSYDIGLWQAPDGNEYLFTVIEWLDGETLDDVMRGELGSKPWPLPRVLATLAPAAHGLALAHRCGVAHRDVKPANIFLLDDGSAKLLDFGIAKVAAEHPEGFQATNAAFAAFTAGYAAPEQLDRKVGSTGPWTDVHALALICVELLCGRRLRSGDELALAALLQDPARRPTPRAMGADVSDAVEAVFARALAHTPAARYGDADAFFDALTAAATPVVAPAQQRASWAPLAAASVAGAAVALLLSQLLR